MDYETKYISSNSRATTLKGWLESSFPPDPQYPETIISSIYYDTRTMTYLSEKQASDHIKSKFRIRWYEDLNTRDPSKVCFLEMKHKIGENRFKKRLQIDNSFSSLPLDSNRLLTILDELRVYNGNVLEQIYPSFIVSYKRKRFIIPDTEIRLCIDYDINVPKTNINLMQKDPKPMLLSQCVFELKGPTAILPKECYFLEKLGTRKDAFSKYERCFYELIE